MKSTEADAVLAKSLDRLLAGSLPAAVHLDLLDAAAARGTPVLKSQLDTFESRRSGDDPLAKYRETLAGGNAARGRTIFFDKAEVSCVRCHKIDGNGGEVGPDLSKISSQQKRDYLLEAIVLPDKQIAKGFDTVVLALVSGKVVSGIVKEDTGKSLKLITPEGQTIVVAKSDIEEQARGKSAMPEDVVQKLTKSELRDLVEFLAGLK
jgi:quinoprotein glucose dehydrogenase